MEVLNKTIKIESEVVIEKQIKKETRLLNSLKPKKGQKTFKLVKGIISEPSEEEYTRSVLEFKSIDIFGVSNGQTIIKPTRRIKTEVGAAYVVALNLKNARKKFIKMGLIVKN